METDFHLICEDARQFDFLLGWTLFKELSMRNACDTAPLTSGEWKSYGWSDKGATSVLANEFNKVPSIQLKKK